jgi:hypothetical protein
MDVIPLITLGFGLTATITSTFLFSLERILKIKAQRLKIQKLIGKGTEEYDDLSLIKPVMD